MLSTVGVVFLSPLVAMLQGSAEDRSEVVVHGNRGYNNKLDLELPQGTPNSRSILIWAGIVVQKEAQAFLLLPFCSGKKGDKYLSNTIRCSAFRTSQIKKNNNKSRTPVKWERIHTIVVRKLDVLLAPHRRVCNHSQLFDSLPAADRLAADR